MFKQLIERIDNLSQLTEKEKKTIEFIHDRIELYKDARNTYQIKALYTYLENYVYSIELGYFSRFTK